MRPLATGKEEMSTIYTFEVIVNAVHLYLIVMACNLSNKSLQIRFRIQNLSLF